VKAQTHFVRVSKLMLELVAATAPPPVQASIAALPAEQAKLSQKKTAQSDKSAQSKLAHGKPAPKNGAAPQKPAARPAPGVRVVGRMKDQSRLPAARVSAKPSDTAVRHVAVQ
jgi:hypothetical protein